MKPIPLTYRTRKRLLLRIFFDVLGILALILVLIKIWSAT